MARKYKINTYVGTIGGALDGAKADIESLKDEMTEWRDNLDSNGMSHMPKYDEVSECVDALERIYDNLDGIDLSELPGDVVDRSVSYTEMSPYGRKPMPQWMRFENAQSMISAAKAGIEAARDDQPENPGCECSEDNADADDEYGDHHELDCPLYREDGDDPDAVDWDTPIDALEEAENEGVEFPGMY